MKSRCKLLFSSFLLLSLAGCGGGGGASGSGSGGSTPPPPTPSQIIQNAQAYSAVQLKTAATQLTEERYTGLTSAAALNAEVAQRVYYYLFYDSLAAFPEVGNENFQSQVDSNGNIDISFACDYQGTVRYKGKIDSASKGTLTLTYSNCEQGYIGYPISGTVAMTIGEISDSAEDYTLYFDNLSWQTNGQAVRLSGYSTVKAEEFLSTNRFTYLVEQHVLYVINNDEQALMDIVLEVEGRGNVLSFDIYGDMAFANAGKVTFNFEDIDGFPPYIWQGKMLLNGQQSAAFEFGPEHIRYVQDSDNDGEFDVGTYFSDITELLEGNASAKQLVALANLSLPPRVYSPNWNYYGDTLNTTDTIEVSEGYYEDPDSPYEDLIVSYRWYVNGEIVPDLNTAVFPPYTAFFGDVVSVSMLVSDGVNVVESSTLDIELGDAPAEIKISNFPDSVKPGDLVQFLAEVSDPDLIQANITSSMISGPDGAQIDESGVVTWNVPSDLLFPFQFYQFTFGLPDANGHISDKMVVPIKIESDKALPLARSGINVPQSNQSMWIGDFDGDGKNEILSTDGRSSVFLLAFDGTRYQQSWVYPFKVGADANIKQVLAANIDDDAQQEIIVITGNTISVINGLDSTATTLLTSENELHFAAVGDIDKDGRPELAYLSSSYQYPDNNMLLNVVSFAAPATSLFSTNVSEARQIQFANVDADSNVELITNNGLVYDTSTWSNQWFSGTQFGDNNVTSGDYNGDGIDEIAGANTWGSLAVYSAVNKAQLDSFDNFNTCSLHSADLNADGRDELIVGDCQWGNISVYQMVNNKLALLWQVNLQDHGSVSLISGDSDNDGKLELHWGTGISHSGENKFIVADVVSAGLEVKEEAISSQLDGFSSAGWANVTDNQERAVFFVPSSQNGYGGSHIVTLDENGSYEVSDEISSNWDNSAYAAVTDFNNDGLGDIFLPSTSTYDGAFAAMQLNDNSIHWQTSGSYDSNIGMIRAFDLNADGSDDAVYADSRVLKAIDISNQNIIANYTFSSFINDFVPVRINNTATVLVSVGDKLSFLQIDGAAFSEKSFISQTCSRIELLNYDTDAELELVCLQGDNGYYSSQELVVFDLDGNTFTELARNALTINVLDIAVDPTKTEQQNLFLITQKGSDFSYWDDTNEYQIAQASALGNIIWSSPALVGLPTSHGLKIRQTSEGKIELMLSTSSLMYWIK
ncbi:MAG: VCBS repeat-containing protein [Paraglaciecola sp.]|nr:VCBS repeat-containing protein [Paraglaciecola sp.]